MKKFFDWFLEVGDEFCAIILLAWGFTVLGGMSSTTALQTMETWKAIVGWICGSLGVISGFIWYVKIRIDGMDARNTDTEEK